MAVVCASLASLVVASPQWAQEGPALQPALGLGPHLLRETARDYREQSRYPNDSWPLKLGQADPVKDERTPTPVSARSEGLELAVWAGVAGFEAPEPVDLFASLSSAGQPLEAQQITGEVVSGSGGVLGRFQYADDGVSADEKAGDGIYSARLDWIPTPELAEIYLVRVEATTASDKRLHAAGGFLYGRPWAHLTGRYRDTLRDGNVITAAEVDVTRSGRFHLTGTLYSNEKEPLGVAQNAAELEPGRHWIELTFFALMFHDRGAAGPYRLGSVALTTVSALPGAPSRLARDVHITKPYGLSSLRSAPVDRADLIRAAERLEAAADSVEAAAGGGTVAVAAEPCLIFVHGVNDDSTYEDWNEARNYWCDSYFCIEATNDFIRTATNNFARSHYVVGYDGTRPWHDARVAGEVASEIVNATNGGIDGGNNKCSRSYAQGGTFWVIAHSMGGTVMDFILGNDDQTDLNYNFNGRYDQVAQRISGVISLSGAHRGSQLTDWLCGDDGNRCDSDEAEYWLRTAEEVQVKAKSSPPARTVYLTGGHQRFSCSDLSHYHVPACISSALLSDQDDGAVQYASIYACDGLASHVYGNLDVCDRSHKQETFGFRNLDAGEENHNTIHLDNDRDTRTTVPDGIWTCGGVTCPPNTPAPGSPMSAAQLVNDIFTTRCLSSLHPTTQAFPGVGGSGSVRVGRTSACGSWSSVSNSPPWLTITSLDADSVHYSVASNPSFVPRTGTLTIAGETFTVVQDGGGATCSYSINPTSQSAQSGGGPGSVTVTAGIGCGWTASSNATPWLTITAGGSGGGNGSVSYNVAANGSASPRSGTLTIAGKTFTVTQDGAVQGNDYPYAAASCSAGDPWNFVTRQCTSFAAWRMNRDAGVTALNLPENSYPFSNHMGGRLTDPNRLSDAAGWATKLQGLGYAVDGSPRVGDIAHWLAWERGALAAGHVAYVSAVNGDGSVDVEEYNWLTCAYGTRHLSGATSPLRYIHFNSSRLVVRPNSEDVYFLQNGRVYHVLSYPLVVAMESAGMPGWVWSTRRYVDQAEWAQYTVGPEFLAADYRSNGLLIQEAGTFPVYLMDGGQRRWVRTVDAVNCLGGFPNLIEVPSAVLSSYVPSVGAEMPLSTTSASHAASGGSGAISVTPGGVCPWTAVSNDANWLTVTGGWSGSGNGTVTYSVAPNPSTSPRTGTLTIAGQTFTVEQAGLSCAYSISPTLQSFLAGGGSGAVNVTATSGCVWSAVTTAPSWLTVTSGSSGYGSGTVSYSVATNTTSSPRTGTLVIAGQTFTVTQAGSTCSYSISPTSQSASGASGSGVVSVTAAAGCSWSAVSNDPTWVTVTAGQSGSGNGSVSYAFASNPSAFPRAGTLTVAGLTFTLTQAGSGVSNDEISGATLLPSLPADVVQDTSTATGNVSDPVHTCGSQTRDSNTVWFRYVATFTATLRVSTSTSSYDTVLTAYAGTTGVGPELACSDDTNGTWQSEIGFAVTSGQSYLIEVSGYGSTSAGGGLVLSVAPAGYAFFDTPLRVPKCSSVGTMCDSGSLLVGRANLGPEPNQPNTLGASCADGLDGSFHSDESNDRLKVSTLDGTNFAAGKAVMVEATVWAYSSYSSDWLDLYYAADATSASWTLIGTLTPTMAGAQTLWATYTLPAGPLQAIRARFRFNGGAAPCGAGGAGSYEDHDDLVFAVGTAPTVVTGTATSISPSGATLTGAVNPNGASTTTQFEYGTSTSYGNPVVAQTLVGWTPQGIAASISGLTCGTPYHFRAKASNAGGTVSGGDAVFSTAACPGISGTVTDAATGLPLAEVQVGVYNSAGIYVGYGQSSSSGLYVLSTGLPAGTYYARTTNWADYIDELYNDIACAAGACTVTSGTPISVTAGATTTGVDFGLARGGRISGTVTNASTGVPLANVWVDVAASDGSSVAYGYTDSSGVYTTVPGLNPGIYYARTANSSGHIDELYNNIACPGGVCTVTSGTPISVTAGATTAGVDFGLELGGRISGVVNDAGTGLPLAGIGVYIFPPSGSYVASGYTDSSGAYTVSGLASGTYYARSWDWGDYVDELYDNVSCPGWSCGLSGGTSISVTVGTTTTGIDFSLVRGGQVGGTVTDAATGLALASVDVRLYNATGDYVARGTTGSLGTYTTPGVPSGTYYAETSNAAGHIDELYDDIPCPGGACSPATGTPISVTAGTTSTGIHFALLIAGAISGTVTSTATGLPLASVEIDVFDSSGTWKTYGWTDGSGAYTTLDGLGPGTYYVSTWNSQAYLDELYNNMPCPGGACAVTSGTPVNVGVGTTTGISFDLAPGGRIRGTVTDVTTGVPLAHQRVRIYGWSGTQVMSAYTDTSGVYASSSGLVPGTYYARTSNTLGYVDELYDSIACPGGACTVTSGTPIAVAAGTTMSGIDFELALGGRIRGTVTDAATGQPLTNVVVDVYTSSGSWLTYGYTDGSGVYTTAAGLAAGNYYATTWNSDGYVDELYSNIPCPAGACTVTSGTLIAVSAGTTMSGIDFGLAPGGRIRGTVTDAATGVPVPNVQVDVYTSSDSWLTYGYTDGSGVYTTAAGLAAGNYYATTWNSDGYVDELYSNIPCPGRTCTVTSGTPISVAAGTITAGIDFGLAQGGRISGTATDAATGAPLGSVSVRIYNFSGTQVTAGTTTSAGTYTAWGLPTGTYYARTSNYQGYVDELYDNMACAAGACTVTSGSPISVAAGTITPGIDFGLTLGGEFRGTVTDAATGQPLFFVGVGVYTSSGSWLTYGITNGSGIYTISGLAPGNYYATTWNSYPYLDELYNNISCPGGTCTVTSGTPISVAAGTITPDIDFGLSLGGQIRGTVTDAGTGQPLANVEVDVTSSGSEWTYAYTDGSGTYTADGLAPGNYYATTWNSLGYVDELYDNIACPGGACTWTGATAIAVTAGATTTGIDFGLTSGGRISGTVTDAATGAPLASVTVWIYNSSGTHVTTRTTSSSGTYTTSVGLPTGIYYARTSNSLAYLDELYNNIVCPGGACTVTNGTGIAVTAGATTTGIDFGLGPGGRVSGTVTDAATGAPLASVTVRIYNLSGTQVTTRTTSSAGTYTTTAGLPTGAYYARTSNSQGYVEELYDGITCAGGTCPVTSGTGIAVTAGATTAAIDFSLAAGGRVSGMITDATTGTPLAGAQVRIYDGSGTQLTSGTADASGTYTTGSGLPSGSYYARTANAGGYFDEVYDDIACPAGVCAPTSGTSISVPAGVTTTGINFALVQAPAQTNDEIVGATPISAWPYNSSEDTRTATSNASDPVHACGTGTRDSNTVWFRFASTFNGTVSVSTVNSNYDTVLTAYPGTTSVGPELACNDDVNGTTQSEIGFPVTTGQSYLIEVSTYGAPAGGTLHLTLAQADLSMVKTDSVDPVNAGASFEYTLAVSNGGPSTAQALTVTDTLPAGVTYVSALGTGWACGELTGAVTCTRASLEVGAAPAITITVTAPAVASTLNNTAAVSATTGDPLPGDNSEGESTTVMAQADLSMANTDSADPVNAGASFDYTLAVSNGGPSTAQALTVTDTLSAGVTYVSASGTGWACGELAGTVTCTRASLAVGAAPAITVTVTAPAEGGAINNTAAVSATTGDPLPGNNSEGESTTVTAQADLSMVKTDSADPVNAGASFDYTLAVSNGGPSTTEALTVTDTLPGGVTYVSASGTGWACGELAGTVTCTRATLTLGAAPAITITVTAPAAASTLDNTAAVSATTSDPLPGNNSEGESTTVTAPAFVKGDMNGDGLPDLVFRSNVIGDRNKVWFMDGVVRSAEADITPDAASADWKIRGVDDFNGDGKNDLVFWNQATGNVEFWLMNGTARSGMPVPLSGAPVLNPSWDLSGTADFNGDHQPDIVWRNFTSQKIVIWTMNGSARVGSIVPTPDQAVNANWIVVAALDYNNDGSTDFLWYNYTSGKIVTWYMSASVVRTTGQFTTPSAAGDANWKVLASSDYSHDHVPGTPPLGSPDIVWRNETSGNQVVWHMDFNSVRVHGEFTNPVANSPALDWTVVGPR